MTTRRPSEKSHNVTAGDITSIDARIAFVINSDTSISVLSARSGRPHSLTTCRACNRAQGTAESSAPSSRWLEKGQAAGSDGEETGPPGPDPQLAPAGSGRA